MKWSTVAAVLAAPLALAGSIERDLGFVERRNAMEVRTSHEGEGKSENGGKGQVIKVEGGSTVVIKEIIVIWVNNGGGATTSQVNSATSTENRAVATHTVIVGGAGGLVFTPNQLSAEVNDMVVFQFESQNHTATQSAFDTPCKKLDGGMDTGFMPNLNNSVSPPPQMAMQVKVKTPIWFYCRQKAHCGKGMTFSINPTAEKTQAMFQQLAISQNGTGAAAPIVGGAAPSSVTPPAATVTTAVAAPAGATVAAGQGDGNANVCSCSCLCGVSNFATPAQGIGAFGGLPGSMPMAAMMKL